MQYPVVSATAALAVAVTLAWWAKIDVSVLFDLLLKVKAKFIVEFRFDGVAPEQRSESDQQVAAHGAAP